MTYALVAMSGGCACLAAGAMFRLGGILAESAVARLLDRPKRRAECAQQQERIDPARAQVRHYT